MSISLNEFADRLNKIMPVIMKGFARRSTNELYKGKITLPQLLVLAYLDEQGESRMTDLARFIKVSTAAMTGIVDRLVRYGYLLRVYDPKDRRIIKVKLNAKGASLIKKIAQQRRKMAINIFGKISEAEREDYLRILTRIRDILTKEERT
jgi:DNA-binding MarR family transcriptional regulator